MSKEDKIQKNKLERFLKELGELSEKHGLYIGGSGDLGSPWVAALSDKKFEPFAEHLYFCKQCGCYGQYIDHDDHY